MICVIAKTLSGYSNDEKDKIFHNTVSIKTVLLPNDTVKT